MRNADEILDQQFSEMRARCLSLAADLDRIHRTGGEKLLKSDPRLTKLRQAIDVLQMDASNRAEQVQLIFSDKSPAPNPQSEIRNPK